MAYQRIRQPKLSDVIEQELERLDCRRNLISRAAVATGDVNLQSSLMFLDHQSVKPFNVLEAKRLLTRRQGGGTFVS